VNYNSGAFIPEHGPSKVRLELENLFFVAKWIKNISCGILQITEKPNIHNLVIVDKQEIYK
jgi:hypothetical protein